jgi:hypothetical protein
MATSSNNTNHLMVVEEIALKMEEVALAFYD